MKQLQKISLELNENKINYNKINKVLEISNSKEFVDDLENRENTILHSNGQNCQVVRNKE